ncbi:MAG: TadE/TadG family type IV pilus assembly protein [Actinomycetota bacterium]
MGKQWSGDSRGASLVELALALPLLVMLLVGMVSAGIAYNNQLALTHAAREGGRYAATLPVTNFASPSMENWLDEVAAQVIEDATGSLDPGVEGRYICVAYVHPNGDLSTDSTKSRVEDSSGVTYSDPPAPCFADGRPNDEQRVQVEVRRGSDFNVVFFSTTVNLDSEAVNRFEAGVGF